MLSTFKTSFEAIWDFKLKISFILINNIPILKFNDNIKGNMNNDQNKLDNLSSSNLVHYTPFFINILIIS